MNKVRLSWVGFKNIVNSKRLNMQKTENSRFYTLFAIDSGIKYECQIYKATTKKDDQIDFEENFLVNCNNLIQPKTIDGKEKVLSISRPDDTYTYFTTRGDSTDKIGGGKRIEWDFSNANDNVVSANPAYKKKEITIDFIDEVWVKEGALFFFNKLKGSYVCIYIVCPAGQYYLKNDGTPVLATVDTRITYYVSRHPMQGSVPMGVNFQTEGATENGMQVGYKVLIEVVVPVEDNSSNGCIEIECYRKRTVILN